MRKSLKIELNSYTLANLDPYPESVPLNKLVPIKGTPLEGTTQIDDIEFIKTIAIARILMPKARIETFCWKENS